MDSKTPSSMVSERDGARSRAVGTHPVQTVRVTEWHVGEERRICDDIVAEEPLEIRVNGAPVSVTMRTPGDDLDLALGFLFTEGIIDEARHVARIDHARNDGSD